MNLTQKGVVALLKAAITGEKVPLPEGFDLGEAIRLTGPHHIGAMVYEGATRCGIDPQTPAMQKLFQHYCKAVQISRRQMRELERVFAAFDADGIDYMPLKGSVIKALYPKPELRTMGDADVLIRLAQYQQIIPIMQALGFEADKETEHELVWRTGALMLELHKCLIPEATSDYYTCYGDGWLRAQCTAGSRYAFSPEDTFIFLFAHFAKHYRTSGIGCRHLVDLWVFLRAHPELDEAYVQQVLDKLYLGAFYRNIRRTIAMWFEDGDADDAVDLITEVIFANGSWGTAEQAIVAAGVRDIQRADQKFQGKTAYIIRRLFPGKEYLQMNYPILKKAPYLLPGVWVYFLISRTLFTKGAWRKHSRNLSALTKENVETHRQMLDFVGLDYYH